jgi:hypothetical protein
MLALCRPVFHYRGSYRPCKGFSAKILAFASDLTFIRPSATMTAAVDAVDAVIGKI